MEIYFFFKFSISYCLTSCFVLLIMVAIRKGIDSVLGTCETSGFVFCHILTLSWACTSDISDGLLFINLLLFSSSKINLHCMISISWTLISPLFIWSFTSFIFKISSLGGKVHSSLCHSKSQKSSGGGGIRISLLVPLGKLISTENVQYHIK